MVRITTEVTGELARVLDAAAAEMDLSRAEVVRRALKRYLEETGELRLGGEVREDPGESPLDRADVRWDLIDPDQA